MIEPELRAFLEGGAGIHIGSRTAALEPNGARVTAVKVEDDLLHLLIYVPEAAAVRVLPDLETNGAAAVVFARPSPLARKMSAAALRIVRVVVSCIRDLLVTDGDYGESTSHEP